MEKDWTLFANKIFGYAEFLKKQGFKQPIPAFLGSKSCNSDL
jgi:hypothetical protein